MQLCVPAALASTLCSPSRPTRFRQKLMRALGVLTRDASHNADGDFLSTALGSDGRYSPVTVVSRAAHFRARHLAYVAALLHVSSDSDSDFRLALGRPRLGRPAGDSAQYHARTRQHSRTARCGSGSPASDISVNPLSSTRSRNTHEPPCCDPGMHAARLHTPSRRRRRQHAV